MAVINAIQKAKSVADPSAVYESMRPLWEKSRAVIGGERFVKDYDNYLDIIAFSNLLLPFSPSMTKQQYEFYKAEAELPGIVAQYSRTIVGGLLRKQPQLKLPEGIPEGAYDWIMTSFAQNGLPLVSFLDDVLWEEMKTSRVWIYVDFPNVENADRLSKEEMEALKPYPIIWNAESIINWRLDNHPATGQQYLRQVIIRNYEEVYDKSEFHPSFLDTVWVHEIVDGYYQIRKFQKAAEDSQIPVMNGKIQQQYAQGTVGTDIRLSAYQHISTIDTIQLGGERLTMIPAWPANGSFVVKEPILMPLIDKEISLYNKISRRNHLLYGAATYTPIISSDMPDEDFQDIVGQGLGSWIKLRAGDNASVLDTPTSALADMDRAIAASIEDMAKLGVRMMAPETNQAGVALDIRNAGQTAQLGTLNTKLGNQMATVIAFMIRWRYGLEVSSVDIGFELSDDFNSAPLGSDWLRLATEWYEKGFIPRSVWLTMLKQNDIMQADYNDESGKVEIDEDERVFSTKENMDYAMQKNQQQTELAAAQAGMPTEG